jgi:hypothetical protein
MLDDLGEVVQFTGFGDDVSELLGWDVGVHITYIE